MQANDHRISVKLDISAPHIILPENFHDRETAMVSKHVLKSEITYHNLYVNTVLLYCCTLPYFFAYYFFSLLVIVRLLFEGGVYFFGKPADINDGWIRYVQAIQ